MGKEITSLAVLNESVFAAAGDFVGRYVRGKEVGRFVVGFRASYDSSSDSDSDSDASSSTASSSSASSSSSSDSDDDDDSDATAHETLSNLLLFGNTLVALSSTGKRLYVWDVPPYVKPASRGPLPNGGKDAEEDPENAGSETDEDEAHEARTTPYAVLEMPVGFTATKVVHPASYLNKVVVGSKEGELAVWNVRTGCVTAEPYAPPRFRSHRLPQVLHPHLPLHRPLRCISPFRRHRHLAISRHRRSRCRSRFRRMRPV